MTHPTQFSPTASSASGQRDDGRLTMVARVDDAEKAQTMTASTLRSCTIKDLARMAKRRGVNGWHAMRKDQLVRALLRIAKAKPIESKSAKKIAPPVRRVVAAKNGSAGHPVVTHSRSSLNGSAHHGSAHVNGVRNGSCRSAIARNGAAPVAAWRTIVLRIRRSTPRQLAERARISRRIEQAKVRLSRSKNLAFIQPDEKLTAQAKDRLIVMVRGPFWLHAYWELTAQGIARAQAALGQDWHRARPVLRVLVVTSRNATTTSERVIRDIAVHGGVKNWYVDVQEPPQTYRLEIGYLAAERQVLLAGSQQCRDHAGRGRNRHARRPLAGRVARLRQDLRHERWLLGRGEHRIARTVRRTAAPTDGHAGQRRAGGRDRWPGAAPTRSAISDRSGNGDPRRDSGGSPGNACKASR